MDSIDSFTANVAAEAFREYEANCIPVLIKKGCQRWAAISQWSEEYLRDKIGSCEAEVTVAANSFLEGDVHRRAVACFRVDTFLDLTSDDPDCRVASARHVADSTGSPCNPDWFFSIQQCPIFMAEGAAPLSALLPDVEVPAFLDLPPLPHSEGGACGLHRPYKSRLAEQINMWANGRRLTTSSTHFDAYHNILCVVAGKKTIHLYAPAASVALRPGSLLGKCWNHAYPPNGRDSTKETPLPPPPPFVVEAHPGDMVFIPEGWYHQVTSEARTLAVNIWWNGPGNVMASHTQMLPYYLRRVLRESIDVARMELQSHQDAGRAADSSRVHVPAAAIFRDSVDSVVLFLRRSTPVAAVQIIYVAAKSGNKDRDCVARCILHFAPVDIDWLTDTFESLDATPNIAARLPIPESNCVTVDSVAQLTSMDVFYEAFFAMFSENSFYRARRTKSTSYDWTQADYSTENFNFYDAEAPLRGSDNIREFLHKSKEQFAAKALLRVVRDLACPDLATLSTSDRIRAAADRMAPWVCRISSDMSELPDLVRHANRESRPLHVSVGTEDCHKQSARYSDAIKAAMKSFGSPVVAKALETHLASTRSILSEHSPTELSSDTTAVFLYHPQHGESDWEATGPGPGSDKDSSFGVFSDSLETASSGRQSVSGVESDA
eukprot:Rmarinus@m.29373